MTKIQRLEIEKLLKQNQVIVNTITVKSGVDNEGFPVFETRFENPPQDYKLVRLIEPWKGAILEDLSPQA